MSDSKGMNKNGSNVDQTVADEEDIVNPWEVSTHSAKGVDYDKLISKFFLIRFHKHLYIYVKKIMCLISFSIVLM